jgi:uncharacterized protein YjiS (DUF1127 family)
MSLIQLTRAQHSRLLATGGALGRFLRAIQHDAQTLWYVVSEWHRRSVSRRELRMFKEAERRDLGFRADFEGEANKPFWQA